MPSFCEVAGFRLSLTAVNYIALEMPVAGRAGTIMANNVRRKRDLSEPGHRVPPTGLDGPLLGILPANVLVFGMYFAAGNDPTVAGGATGLNLASWALFRILIEGKMRCLFSMVFGASMILLTSRVEERSGATAADIYYRRNLWLLLFGLAHAFQLFWGDILYPYALCALILFPFRELPAKKPDPTTAGGDWSSCALPIFWLLLFGLAHAFQLFWGDILYPYALCALILFPFRELPAKK